MKTCVKMCKECPFSNKSLPGYLGPHKLEDIINYKNTDYPFTCHMQRGDDVFENGADQIDVCKGYINWSVKVAHMFKDPELRRLQQEVVRESEDFKTTLGLMEFFNHHKNKI